MSATGEHSLANLKRAARYYGVYTRVGKRCGVTKSHVRAVALGIRHSPRVMKELLRELKAVEREIAKEENAA